MINGLCKCASSTVFLVFYSFEPFSKIIVHVESSTKL